MYSVISSGALSHLFGTCFSSLDKRRFLYLCMQLLKPKSQKYPETIAIVCRCISGYDDTSCQGDVFLEINCTFVSTPPPPLPMCSFRFYEQQLLQDSFKGRFDSAAMEHWLRNHWTAEKIGMDFIGMVHSSNIWQQRKRKFIGNDTQVS